VPPVLCGHARSFEVTDFSLLVLALGIEYGRAIPSYPLLPWLSRVSSLDSFHSLSCCAPEQFFYLEPFIVLLFVPMRRSAIALNSLLYRFLSLSSPARFLLLEIEFFFGIYYPCDIHVS